MGGCIVVVQDSVAIPPFSVIFGKLIHANVAQSSAISCTVNLWLLRTIVLTLSIISSFLDVDGRPEQGSLSPEVLPSF